MRTCDGDIKAVASGYGYCHVEEFLREWGEPDDGFCSDELAELTMLWQENFRSGDIPTHSCQDHGTREISHRPAISQP
jgi:hypothetical protein